MSSTVASTTPRSVRAWTVRSTSSASDEGFVLALLEATHVDQPGGDDLSAVDGSDAGHRHEDPAPAGHLDHQADNAGAALPREDDHHITHAPDLVAERVEDAQLRPAGQRRLGWGRSRDLRLSGPVKSGAEVGSQQARRGGHGCTLEHSRCATRRIDQGGRDVR
jgi:hypothetical protein